MSKRDKLLRRLFSKPTDFTWGELTTLLTNLGFRAIQGDGSRVKFICHEKADAMITLHRPHPGNEIKTYIVVKIIKNLKQLGIKP